MPTNPVSSVQYCNDGHHDHAAGLQHESRFFLLLLLDGSGPYGGRRDHDAEEQDAEEEEEMPRMCKGCCRMLNAECHGHG